MRFLKLTIVWIAMAAIVELSVFQYLDKYFFKPDTSFKAIKIVKADINKTPKLQIKLPSDINIKYLPSNNGKYILYGDDAGTKIDILNTVDGSTNELSVGENEKFSYYVWVPDTNRIFIIKKLINEKKFKMYYYDVVVKDKLVEVKNFMDGSAEGKEVSMPLKNNLAEAVAVQISTYNGVTYVQFKNNGRKDVIYRMDRMCYLNSLDPKELSAKVIGNVLSTKHSEKLVYEDALNGKIFVTGQKNSLAIPNVSKEVLLGVDSFDDTVYIGQEEQNKITKIFYGQVDQSIDKWATIPLNSPVDKNQILVEANSQIFLNDNATGVIYDLKNNKKTAYKGRFLQLYSNGIFSESQGVLRKTVFGK